MDGSGGKRRTAPAARRPSPPASVVYFFAGAARLAFLVSPGAPAVLVDELDAGGLQRCSNFFSFALWVSRWLKKILAGPTSLTVAPLSVDQMPGSSWATTRLPGFVCGVKNAARLSRRTGPTTGLSSSGLPRRTSTGAGMSATPARPSGASGCGSVLKWMAATLDGVVDPGGAVFEAKFMLPWSFSEEAAAEKYMPQLQHNMWVVAARSAVLSVITGGGKWVEITTHADPLYQHLIVTAERKFWRCVESGEPPRLFGVEPPKPRIEAVRIVDMSGSNSWAEFADLFRSTRQAFLDHERSKAELKALIPEDAKEAIGRGIRAKRSKSGAISFDLLGVEDGRAALQ